MKKAIVYFSGFFKDEMLQPLIQHEASLSKAVKVKKYLKTVSDVKYALTIQLKKLHEARYGDLELNPFSIEEEQEIADLKKSATKKKKDLPAGKAGKGEKGSSLKETLAFYRAGKNIEEIARLRSLAASTIEGHLALLVKAGELDIHELMNAERLEIILHAIGEGEGSSMGRGRSLARLRER